MKRIVPILLLGLALSSGAAAARAASASGAFGGMSIPVVQEDAKTGAVYGVRVPVTVMPLVTVEPYCARTRPGDDEETFGGLTYTRDGGEISAFGLNVHAGRGGPLRFYPFAGIGSYRLTRDGDATTAPRSATTLGLGLGLSPLPKLDGRPARRVRRHRRSTRRRGSAANVTLGVSYHLPPPCP